MRHAARLCLSRDERKLQEWLDNGTDCAGLCRLKVLTGDAHLTAFALFNFHGDDRFAMPKVGIATRHSIAALRELILAVPCSAREAAHASLARWYAFSSDAKEQTLWLGIPTGYGQTY